MGGQGRGSRPSERPGKRGFQVRLEQLGQRLRHRREGDRQPQALRAPRASARRRRGARAAGGAGPRARARAPRSSRRVQTAASIRVLLDIGGRHAARDRRGADDGGVAGGAKASTSARWSSAWATRYHGFEDRSYRGSAAASPSDRNGHARGGEPRAAGGAAQGAGALGDLRRAPPARRSRRRRSPRGARCWRRWAPSTWPTPTCSAPSSTARSTRGSPERRQPPTPRWRRRAARRSSPPRGAWWTRSTARSAAATPRTTTPCGAACPNPSLRGRPDLLEPAAGLPDPENLAGRFLAASCPPPAGSPASPSRRSTAGRSASPRRSWTRSPIRSRSARCGHLQSLERGASGAPRLLTIVRERGRHPAPRRAEHPPAVRDAQQRAVPRVRRNVTPGAIRWRSSSAGAAGATAWASVRPGRSAGRRPARTTGRSSGTTSMAPRSCASTSSYGPGGRCPGRTPGPRGGTGVPFRSYVGPAREPVRTHPSPPPPPSGSDRDPRHAPGAAVPRQRAGAPAPAELRLGEVAGGDRIRPKPQAVTLRNIDPRAWAKNRATAREQERPEPQRRAEAAKKPEPKDDEPEGSGGRRGPRQRQESPDAKFLAEKNNRVDKETKAKEQTAFYRNAMPRRTATKERNTTGKDSASQIVVQGNGGRARTSARPRGRRTAPGVRRAHREAARADRPQGADQHGPRGERQRTGRSAPLQGNSDRLRVDPGRPGEEGDQGSAGKAGLPTLSQLMPSSAALDKISGPRPTTTSTSRRARAPSSTPRSGSTPASSTG